MKIVIEAEAKEIADLIITIQSQQNRTISNFTNVAMLLEEAKHGDLGSLEIIKNLLNA